MFKKAYSFKYPPRQIAACIISKHVTHIINLSIITSQVPEDFQSAPVVPLFQSCGKRIYLQLENSLKTHNLLYNLQSGFYSTDSCLLYLTELFKEIASKDLDTGMVLLDLQKAFDTVE